LLDRIEVRLLAQGGQIRQRGESVPLCPVIHHFTPGLYIREIHIPAGTALTTNIHRTEHPFVVSKGACLVYLENEDRAEEIVAPYFGITKPGTRRFLIAVSDLVWTTFHPTDKTDVGEIEDEILEPRQNHLLVEAT